MISRDRVIRTLNHRSIDRAPRDLWLSPAVEANRPDDVAEINVRFPCDVLHVNVKHASARRGKTPQSKSGIHADAWGCVWQFDEHGVATGLVESPLAASSDLAAYHPPTELLESSRFTKVNPACEATGRFTLAHSEVRPLDRLRQLRGPELAERELEEGGKHLHDLIARLHQFFSRKIELWAKTQVDGVVLGDDLRWAATSRANLKTWRTLFKPLVGQYCSILHNHDKFVFFACDGLPADALGDLAEIGVDAVHAPWPLEELERCAARHRHRITFWGGLDPKTFEPAMPATAIRDAVFRMRKALDFGAGGVISQIHWAENVSLRSIAGYFEQWLIPLPVTV